MARVQGHDRDMVAAKYGVKSWTIRKREQREGWPLLDKARKELSKLAKEPVQMAPKEPKIDSNGGVKALTQDNLSQIALNHPILMAEYLQKKRDQMLSQDLLSAPDNWKNANTLDQMLRRAAGLDRPQTQVQVNLWQGSGAAPVQTFDID